MNFDDFQAPSLLRPNLGLSSNASIRSTTSKLSLRRYDRLSVSNRGRGAQHVSSTYLQNESQRLSPPPEDLWVREPSQPSATSTPKNTRTPFIHDHAQHLHNQKENNHVAPPHRNSSSSESTKENTSTKPAFPVKRKAKTKNVPVNNTDRIIVTESESIFKSPDKLPDPVFPVFISPQKSKDNFTNSNVVTPSKDPRSPSSSKFGRGLGATKAPSKVPKPSPSKPGRGRGSTAGTPSKDPLPSPSKTGRSRGSTAKSVPLESQGFCPICQVPFTCINKLPGVHSNNCEVPEDSPECLLGKKCRNKSFYHYLDFRHTALADERAEEKALEGSDHSDIDLNLVDANTDLLDDSSENSYCKKRKLDHPNYSQTKRTRSINLFPEDDSKKTHPNNHDLGTSAIQNECEDSETEDEPNPFLDTEEQEYVPDDSEALPDNGLVLAQDDVETVVFEDETTDLQVDKLENMVESLLPCIPGVCNSNQVAVTLTVANSVGNPLKVHGVGGPDGWQQVDSSDGLSVTKCRCKHNLHIKCLDSQSKKPDVQVQIHEKEDKASGPSAKSLWGPLMKKMTSNSSSSSSSSVSSVSSSISSTSSFSERRCPYFKLIPSTKFAVDAFNCGDVPGVKFYFLSHFHYDHYIGLTKKWKNVIYCSAITARLAQQQLKVQPELLRVLEVDQTTKVDGVMVTALDANHCPGSLMLLFQLSDGTNHLHTGDFRASAHMESYSAFWNLDVQNLYLDTTYCNKKYDFPTQEEVVHWAAERAEVNAASGKKCLFVCGSYTIGKEKVFIAIAEKLDCKIWAQPQKLRVLKTLEDPRISKRITTNKEDARVHVLPMSHISLQTMKDYLQSLKGRFTEIIAFKPSGWQYSGENNTMHSLQQHGNITLCGLPYSEHSSFSELKRFVQFLRPRQVIPTVRSKDCTWQQIKATCQEWLRCSNVSINKAYQSSNPTQSSLKHWRKDPPH